MGAINRPLQSALLPDLFVNLHHYAHKRQVKNCWVERRNGEHSRGSSRGCPGCTKEQPVRRTLRTRASFVAPGQPREPPLLLPDHSLICLHLTPLGVMNEGPYSPLYFSGNDAKTLRAPVQQFNARLIIYSMVYS